MRQTRVIDLQAARRRQLGRDHRPGQRARRARRQRRRPVGARGRAHGRPRAADPRDGAPVPDHRGHAGAQGPEGAAALHRLRGRDLHAPGARRHADGHLRARRRAVVAARRRRGTSARTCCRTTSSASRRRLEVGFEHFPRARERRHPQGRQRPVHLRARRQSADRPGARAAELLGRLRRHGGLQPGRRRRPRARRTGWSTATRAPTSGAWTSRATATGRRSPTPTPRCARTTRGASASASRTRSCRRRGRCARRRSTSGCRPRTRCSATTAGSSIRCGSRRRARRAARGRHLPPLERARARRRGVPRGARRASGCSRSPTTASSRSRGPAPPNGSARVMANKVPAVGRIALTPMLNERGRLIGDFTMCRVAAERFFLVGTYAAEVLLPALVRAHLPPAGVTRAPLRDGIRRACRSPAPARARCCRRSCATTCRRRRSRSCRSGAWTSAWCRPGRPRLLHRRPRLRDLGHDRLPARALRPADRGRPRRSACKPFGGRALNSMRLEKSFGTWAREFRPIYGPFEAGLGRFVDLKKGDFIGRAAALAEQASGGERRLITLDVEARGRRRDRRRADLARRQGGRLGHLRRLRPPRRQVARARLRAGGAGRGDRAASRSSSSASAGPRRASSARPSIRRARACAAEERGASRRTASVAAAGAAARADRRAAGPAAPARRRRRRRP